MPLVISCATVAQPKLKEKKNTLEALNEKEDSALWSAVKAVTINRLRNRAVKSDTPQCLASGFLFWQTMARHHLAAWPDDGAGNGAEKDAPLR